MPGSMCQDSCPSCLRTELVDDYVSGLTICVSCGAVLPDRLSLADHSSAPQSCPELADINNPQLEDMDEKFGNRTESPKHSSLLPAVIALAQNVSRELFFIERKRDQAATAVSLYMACKLVDTPRSMKDMCALTQTPLKCAWTLYNRAMRIKRFARMFSKQGSRESCYPSTTAGITARILDALLRQKNLELEQLDHERMQLKCEALVVQLYRHNPHTPPETLAATALFVILSRCQSRIQVKSTRPSESESVVLDLDDIAKAAHITATDIVNTWEACPDTLKMPSPLRKQ